MMLFYQVWEEARALPFDDAVSRLCGLHRLAQHHPALQPEMELLSELDRIHDLLCNNPISERYVKL